MRLLARLHRWLGVGFCLLLTMWFSTGFVMMYVPFPALAETARLAAAAPLRPGAVSVAPAAAVEGLPVARLRLIQTLGEPRYLATLIDTSVRSIAADGGPAPAPLDAATAARVAAAFAQGPVRAVSDRFDYDQWVVHQRFDAARPFYRVDLDDGAGTELYVSARLGQVLQRTTRFERGWNYVGAVAHWIYPTILRKDHAAWDTTVWWLALGALAATLTGYGLGVLRWTAQRRSRRPGVSPFRGWLRWHHVVGLGGGLFALTWLFSGWLSMDHGRLFSLDQPPARREVLFRGSDLGTAFSGLHARDLAPLTAARELEFFVVAGQGYILQRAPDGVGSLFPVVDGRIQAAIAAVPDALLLHAVQAAYAQVRVLGIDPIDPHDPYAHTRSDPLPASARRVRLADAGATWVHIDARSGRILSQMDTSRRLYRWLFSGLHGFDVPLLNGAGVLRQALMLAALAAGLILGVSAVVLAARRIRRTCGRRAMRAEGDRLQGRERAARIYLPEQ
jgi:hypothetical protein